MSAHRIKPILWVALCFFFTAPCFAACLGTVKSPCIVQDTSADNLELKHYRDMTMIANTYPGDTHGLKTEWVSGSGAPHAADFPRLITLINHLTQGGASHIIDIDLRQESHGYLNGEAITLAEQHDWINRGKSKQKALADEANWLRQLRRQGIVTNVLTAKSFKEGHLDDGANISVQNVQTEEEVVKAAHLDYVRLMVTDHMAPSDSSVDRFVALVDAQNNQTWLHLHCRGGDGRTTTFLAMYDMLKNADQVSFNDILHRQAAVSPFYDLFKLNHKDPELTQYYKERLQFLREFYRYSKAKLHGYAGTWSKWKGVKE